MIFFSISLKLAWTHYTVHLRRYFLILFTPSLRCFADLPVNFLHLQVVSAEKKVSYFLGASRLLRELRPSGPEVSPPVAAILSLERLRGRESCHHHETYWPLSVGRVPAPAVMRLAAA